MLNKYPDTPSNNIYRAFCYACYSIALTLAGTRLRFLLSRSHRRDFASSSSRARTNRSNRYRSFISRGIYLASSRVSTDISYRRRNQGWERAHLTRHTWNVSYVKYRCRTLRIGVYIPSCLLSPIRFHETIPATGYRMLRLDEIRDYTCQLHARMVHCYVIAISQLFRATRCVCIYRFTTHPLLFS